MELNKPKKTVKLEANYPKVDSLIDLGSMLDVGKRRTFNAKFGKLLALLEVDVRTLAITAFAQFFDSSLRCFIFKDFQLVPTIEEFDQILGFPSKNVKPYLYVGKYPTLSQVAKVLKIQNNENFKITKKGTTDGFERKTFEDKARDLAAKEDWDTFMDVLALIIYGIVLFPSAKDLISLASIDVFLAFKQKKVNPTYVILADLYYTVNFCFEKKNGGKILCCLPALYVWLVTRIFKHNFKASCPIEDYKMCDIDITTKDEWAAHLVNLDEQKVRWNPKLQNIDKIVYKCGSFPNVPLMGTMGIINYNPILASRQLGFPYHGEPNKEALTPFLILDMHRETSKTKRVQEAWNKIVMVNVREIGKKYCDSNRTYRTWIKEIVEKVNLPFRKHLISDVGESSSQQTSKDNEEVKELKEKAVAMEEENKKLQRERDIMFQENQLLKKKLKNKE